MKPEQSPDMVRLGRALDWVWWGIAGALLVAWFAGWVD